MHLVECGEAGQVPVSGGPRDGCQPTQPGERFDESRVRIAYPVSVPQASPIPNFFLAGSYTFQDYIDSMVITVHTHYVCLYSPNHYVRMYLCVYMYVGGSDQERSALRREDSGPYGRPAEVSPYLFGRSDGRSEPPTAGGLCIGGGKPT